MSNEISVKLFVMDVDGTLTDGKIYCADNGEIFKAFNVKDGYAIAHILPRMGIVPVIITGRMSDIVSVRARELKISEVYQGVQDKSETLKQLMKKYGCTGSRIAYIGDDLNDIGCMKLCGIVGCPNYDVDEVKSISNFVSKYCGGNGAVRDFIEYLSK